jgi:hypothetical protein
MFPQIWLFSSSFKTHNLPKNFKINKWDHKNVAFTVKVFVGEFHELYSFRFTFDTPPSLYIQVNLHA